MMTLRKVDELAERLRDSLRVNGQDSEEMLNYVAIQLSMDEWNELKVQPRFFTHMRPDGVMIFRGIQITARVRFQVKA